MTSNFAYHKVSEKEKQEILKNTKKLLDKFAAKLEKIKVKDKHFSSEISPSGTREEGEGWETESEFREIMFANAPFVEDDCLVAEKGEWKK